MPEGGCSGAARAHAADRLAWLAPSAERLIRNGPSIAMSNCIRLFPGSDTTLTLSLKSLDFYIDGRHFVFRSDNHRDLVAFVAQKPSTATYEEILQDVFGGQSKDIHKLLHQTRATLKNAGLDVEVLKTSRATGVYL